MLLENNAHICQPTCIKSPTASLFCFGWLCFICKFASRTREMHGLDVWLGHYTLFHCICTVVQNHCKKICMAPKKCFWLLQQTCIRPKSDGHVSKMQNKRCCKDKPCLPARLLSLSDCLYLCLPLRLWLLHQKNTRMHSSALSCTALAAFAFAAVASATVWEKTQAIAACNFFKWFCYSMFLLISLLADPYEWNPNIFAHYNYCTLLMANDGS